MKKRLRKKRRVGEFREQAFPIAFRLRGGLDESACFSCLDQLLQWLERSGLQFGGCLDQAHAAGIVERAGRRSATEADRQLVLCWMQTQDSIETAQAGPLFDVWHQPAPECMIAPDD